MNSKMLFHVIWSLVIIRAIFIGFYFYKKKKKKKKEERKKVGIYILQPSTSLITIISKIIYHKK